MVRLPGSTSRPPRAVRMSISGSPSWCTFMPSMRRSSACRASGGSICGSTSGHCGNSNAVSLRGRSSTAPCTCSASRRRRLPNSGRMAGSSITVSASSTMRPIAQLACGVGSQSASRWRGIEKCTPRRIMGPEAGPSADFQVSSVPAGKRATICRSSTSRPPMVINSQYASKPTKTAMASVPMPLRTASVRCRFRRSVRSSSARVSRCSCVASSPSGSRP